MGFRVKLETTLPDRVRHFAKSGKVRFTRLEYDAIAQMIKVLTIIRTREYCLDEWGEAFAPYTWQTLQKKKPKDIENSIYPYMTLMRIKDKLVKKLKSGKVKAKYIKTIKAQIMHFWGEISEVAKAFYGGDSTKGEREKVNLTKSGKMLNSLISKGTQDFAEVSIKVRYGRWIAHGVKGNRKGKGPLPARPFVGLSTAEYRWLNENFTKKVLWNFIEMFVASLYGERRPDQKSPSELANEALRKRPKKNQIQQGA